MTPIFYYRIVIDDCQVEPHQPKENEKERNGNQEIHTLQQKNKDLQNEIWMLKDQLRKQNNVLKNIS